MAKPTDTVPPWASAGPYTPSVYGPTTVELIPNPLAGQPTPWSGLGRTEAGTLVAFAAQGLTPAIPTAAQEFNEWLKRVGEWSNWVEAGSELADADAHVMETDASGHTRAVRHFSTEGYVSIADGPAPLPEGATVAAGKNVIAGAGSTFQADNLVGVELATTKRVSLTSEQPSTGNRQIHHLAGQPRWRDGDDNFLRHSGEPSATFAPAFPVFKNFGPLSTPTDGPVASVTTSGNGLMIVSATADISGTVAGTVARIKIIIDGVDVFDSIYSVSPSDGTVTWSKTFRYLAVGTFDAKIQFDRSAGAGNVNVSQSTITVMMV